MVKDTLVTTDSDVLMGFILSVTIMVRPNIWTVWTNYYSTLVS